MSIILRLAHDRGRANLGWLNSWHTFSFGEYYDPAHMGFGPLRVINDDTVAGGGGFPTHGHKDMEIVSYVLSGALEHKDSLGTGSVIRPGDVQRMSAGQGVRHSEFNASQTEEVHFLQIWIIPQTLGLPAGYEQKSVPPAAKQNDLVLIGSPKGGDHAVTIQQDAHIWAAVLREGKSVTHALAQNRLGWVHVAQGGITLNGIPMNTGDGAAITGAEVLTMTGASPMAEVLVFDLGA